jgi:hypothetical protein
MGANRGYLVINWKPVDAEEAGSRFTLFARTVKCRFERVLCCSARGLSLPVCLKFILTQKGELGAPFVRPLNFQPIRNIFIENVAGSFLCVFHARYVTTIMRLRRRLYK